MVVIIIYRKAGVKILEGMKNLLDKNALGCAIVKYICG